MPETITILTNSHRRDVLDAWELTPAEREAFDHLDWQAIEEGRDSASFVRAYGSVHDLGEFSADWGISRGTGLPASLAGWDAYRSDTFFSGMVVRYGRDEFTGEFDPDVVIVGRFYA